MGDGATIGVDWGTSRFRAYLIGRDGSVLDRRESERGILAVAPGEFPGVLAAAVGDWRRIHPTAPIVACGMVGSRQGWREVPYVACPAGFAEIARRTVAVECPPLGTVRLVPGLACRDDAGIPDVMRGEETQIVGAIDALGSGSHLLVLPGTHSKWATVRDQTIVSFATFMTGELFAVLRDHSILGRLMSRDGFDEAAFARGAAAVAGGGSLLHLLFSARTLGLFDELPAEALESYLSGLLIATEVKDALAATSERPLSVGLVAGAALAPLYARALDRHGVAARDIGEDAAARGLSAIARHLEGSA
jgi:2-dehydro-3-deoxygalactonokinase